MRYKKLTGIILKKQNYREADQIVSVWTREVGKLRVLARALRKPTSKLNFSMQDLAEVEMHLAGSHFPTLIGAKPLCQFNNLHQDLKKAAISFYAVELMLKITADEHPNQPAYNLLSNFLKNLNELNDGEKCRLLLDDFCLQLLEVLGFKIPNETKKIDHRTINKFIEYIIERNLKSEIFMDHVTPNTYQIYG